MASLVGTVRSQKSAEPHSSSRVHGVRSAQRPLFVSESVARLSNAPRNTSGIACQQRYRWHPEKNATQMAAISWPLTAGHVRVVYRRHGLAVARHDIEAEAGAARQQHVLLAGRVVLRVVGAVVAPLPRNVGLGEVVDTCSTAPSV